MQDASSDFVQPESNMQMTLREIADAIAERDGVQDEEAREGIYNRLRGHRDRGNLSASRNTRQGKEARFEERAAAAALLLESAFQTKLAGEAAINIRIAIDEVGEPYKGRLGRGLQVALERMRNQESWVMR